MKEVLCWVPGYEPYHMEENRTEIRTGAWRGEVYTLRYEEGLVQTVIRLIDGRRMCTEILAVLPLELRTNGESVLNDLRAGGLIQTRVVPDNWPGPDGTRSFFLALPGAGQTMEAIEKSRVLLIGLGVFGNRIATGLAQLGTGSITLIDGHKIAAEDRAMSIVYAMAREGIGRAAHLQRFLFRYWPRTVCRAVRLPSAGQRIRALVSEHDLVICALDRPIWTISTAVNHACLEAGVPWVHVTSDSLLVAVGPLFLPGETGCFRCWECGLRSGMTAAQRRDSERFQAERSRVEGEGYVGPPGTADLAAGLLLSDIPFILSGSGSRLPGRYITIDLLTQAMDLCEVRKLPRCLSCARARN